MSTSRKVAKALIIPIPLNGPDFMRFDVFRDFRTKLLIFLLIILFSELLSRMRNFPTKHPIFGSFAQNEKISNKTPFLRDFFPKWKIIQLSTIYLGFLPKMGNLQVETLFLGFLPKMETFHLNTQFSWFLPKMGNVPAT